MGVIFLIKISFSVVTLLGCIFKEKDSEMEICLQVIRETPKNDTCEEA